MRTLGPIEAEFVEPFSGIDGLRELADGRVIVLDTKEKSVKLIDFASGTSAPIGRTGSGPGEYQLPTRLFSLPGDSSALFDMAAYDRLMVIRPDGAPGGTLTLVDSAFGARPFPLTAMDAKGWMYGPAYPPRTSPGAPVAESAAIVRRDRDRHRDTVALFDNRFRSSLGPVTRGSPPPPFAMPDLWAVAADGRIAIATFDPYQVTLINEHGVRIRGPAIPVVPIRVTEAHKEEWRQSAVRPLPALALSRTGPSVARMIKPVWREPAEWPATLPPFLMDALRFAPDGMLWIQRTTDSGADPLFDVINRGGQVAYQVRLPHGTTLVGFGSRSVYLTRTDADDLRYLQRYGLPR